MARPTPRPPLTATRILYPLGRHYSLCGEMMWAAYHNFRTITTLDDVVHLTLQIRRCLNRACPHFVFQPDGTPTRPRASPLLRGHPSQQMAVDPPKVEGPPATAVRDPAVRILCRPAAVGQAFGLHPPEDPVELL